MRIMLVYLLKTPLPKFLNYACSYKYFTINILKTRKKRKKLKKKMFKISILLFFLFFFSSCTVKNCKIQPNYKEIGESALKNSKNMSEIEIATGKITCNY